jgi:hypothetical protein
MTKVFAAKKSTEAINYTVGFAERLTDGKEIVSFAVDKSVYKDTVTDPDASSLTFNGDPLLNIADEVIDGVPQAIGQALIINVGGGLVGQYVLTFSVTTNSTPPETFVTDVILPIAQFVP